MVLDTMSIGRKRALARKRRKLALARTHTEHFIEYALANEKTGEPIRNAWFHNEWQQHVRDNPLSVLISPVEHGKSVQMGLGKMLHLLGENPNRRMAFISNTAKMAQKNLAAIRANIERNTKVREVFPHLKPSDEDEAPWHSTKITVQRDIISRDPSLQVCGVFGDIVGSRLDVIMLDDVLDFANTRSPDQMEKLIQWIESTVIQRLTDGGLLIAIGTPWHPDDLLHCLAEKADFAVYRKGAVKNPDIPEEYWKPLWPEQWPIERLLQRKRIIHPVEFARTYLCVTRTDENARFQRIWLDRAMQLGRGRKIVFEQPRLVTGQPMPCFTGVDLGIGQDEKHDQTSIFTIGLDERMRRVLLNIQTGRWQGPEIVQRLRTTYARFGSLIYCESNQGQEYIIQFSTVEGPIPVIARNTGSNKWNPDFGVESIAVEMQGAMWVLPTGDSGQDVHPEVAAFVKDCLYYRPKEHTPDRLMAAWLARDAAMEFIRPRMEDLDIHNR